MFGFGGRKTGSSKGNNSYEVQIGFNYFHDIKAASHKAALEKVLKSNGIRYLTINEDKQGYGYATRFDMANVYTMVMKNGRYIANMQSGKGYYVIYSM